MFLLLILNFIQKFSQSVRDYEIIYTCIGTGPDLINVKKTADLKLKHVKFNLIENVPNLVEFIKKNKIDFYINLSKSEGMSFAVMEAMSLGIPVICSDIPGNTEIINNKNGYVLKSSNDLEMKKIIEEIKNDLENRTVYKKKIETINFVKNSATNEKAITLTGTGIYNGGTIKNTAGAASHATDGDIESAASSCTGYIVLDLVKDSFNYS